MDIVFKFVHCLKNFFYICIDLVFFLFHKSYRMNIEFTDPQLPQAEDFFF